MAVKMPLVPCRQPHRRRRRRKGQHAASPGRFPPPHSAGSESQALSQSRYIHAMVAVGTKSVPGSSSSTRPMYAKLVMRGSGIRRRMSKAEIGAQTTSNDSPIPGSKKVETPTRSTTMQARSTARQEGVRRASQALAGGSRRGISDVRRLLAVCLGIPTGF